MVIGMVSQFGGNPSVITEHSKLAVVRLHALIQSSLAFVSIVFHTDIRMRLRILCGEVSREVDVDPSQTVADIKLQLFANEIVQRKRVTLIYRGRRLEDAGSLQSYAILEDSVLHAMISDAPAEPSSIRPVRGSDKGAEYLFFFLLAALLGSFWGVYYTTGTAYLSTAGVAMLCVLSLSFLVGVRVLF